MSVLYVRTNLQIYFSGQSQVSPGKVMYLMKNALVEPQKSNNPPAPGYTTYGKRPGATPNAKVIY